MKYKTLIEVLKELKPLKKISENFVCDNCGMEMMDVYIQAIDQAIELVKEYEGVEREKQGKRYITLMNQALGDTELPEKVWKRIAKVNQLILDK